MHRKFSKPRWSLKILKKLTFIRIFQPDFELHFFKISTFFTFPDIYFDWCVVWSRFFYGRKEQGPADLSGTLNMYVKFTEKFLEAFEKKFQSKWGFIKIFQLRRFLTFRAETFFQRNLESFLWTLRTVLSYLGGSPNFVVDITEKNRDRTIRQ